MKFTPELNGEPTFSVRVEADQAAPTIQNIFQYLNRTNREVFAEAYRRYEGHTWYIQCLMNRLYEREKKVSELSQLNAATISVLKGREPQYENLSQFFTENQMNLLKAIASEGVVAQPTSAKFIRDHRLMAVSSVKTALESLEEKELVYRTGEGYMIYDRFMALWLRQL